MFFWADYLFELPPRCSGTATASTIRSSRSPSSNSHWGRVWISCSFGYNILFCSKCYMVHYLVVVLVVVFLQLLGGLANLKWICLTCFTRFSLIANALSHSMHRMFFSFLWTALVWLSRMYFPTVANEHSLHLNRLMFKWTRFTCCMIWTFKEDE